MGFSKPGWDLNKSGPGFRRPRGFGIHLVFRLENIDIFPVEKSIPIETNRGKWEKKTDFLQQMEAQFW